MDKKKILIIGWGIALILIVILAVNIKNKKDADVNINTKKDYSLVANYSKFFTVENCANKYISYLNKKDKANVYKLLSESYLTSNNITEDNVLTKIKTDNKIYNFQAKKMYQKKLNDKQIMYYIYGNLIEQVMDEYLKPVDYYLIVTIDQNKLFSITPYDGKIFKEEAK